MRRIQTVFMALLLLTAFSSCTKIEFGQDYKVCTTNDSTSIMFTDLQNTPFIIEYMKAETDLLELFGEENIHWGDTPPIIATDLSDFQFKADDGIYIDAKSYVGGVPYELPTPGSFQPIKYFHRFYDQNQDIIKYTCMTKDGGAERLRSVNTVYLMGHDNCFTAYYYETTDTPGHPRNAIVISGRKTDEGVTDYRYGIKIIEYTDPNYDPTSVFGEGTIYIFGERDNVAEIFNWYNDNTPSSPDTLP